MLSQSFELQRLPLLLQLFPLDGERVALLAGVASKLTGTIAVFSRLGAGLFALCSGSFLHRASLRSGAIARLGGALAELLCDLALLMLRWVASRKRRMRIRKS